MGSLIIKNNNLPVKIEDLKKFIAINTEKIKNITQQIKSIDELNFAREVRDQKIKELKEISLLTIEAEIKIAYLVDNLISQNGRDKNKFQLKDLGITIHHREISLALRRYQNHMDRLINEILKEKRMPTPAVIYQQINIKFCNTKYKKNKINENDKNAAYKIALNELREINRRLENVKKYEIRKWNICLAIKEIEKLIKN